MGGYIESAGGVIYKWSADGRGNRFHWFPMAYKRRCHSPVGYQLGLFHAGHFCRFSGAAPNVRIKHSVASWRFFRDSSCLLGYSIARVIRSGRSCSGGHKNQLIAPMRSSGRVTHCSGHWVVLPALKSHWSSLERSSMCHLQLAASSIRATVGGFQRAAPKRRRSLPTLLIDYYSPGSVYVWDTLICVLYNVTRAM